MDLPDDLRDALVDAQAAYEEASARRRHAIVAAVAAGGSLRAVAEAAHTSHESIRRLLADASGVEVRFAGVRYPLSFHEASALAGQLDALAGHLDEQSGTAGWAGAARKLAATVRARLGLDEPLTLDRDAAAVLRQLLLLGPPARSRMVRMLLELVSESVG